MAPFTSLASLTSLTVCTSDVSCEAFRSLVSVKPPSKSVRGRFVTLVGQCLSHWSGSGEHGLLDMGFCRLSAVYYRVGRHDNFALVRLSASYKITLSSESTSICTQTTIFDRTKMEAYPNMYTFVWEMSGR